MSRADAMVALTAKPGGTDLSLCAPAVGILTGVPAPGRLLGGGDAFASLTILGRSRPLLVPEGITGVVREVAVDGTGNDTIAVEFGQPILALAPIASAGSDGAVDSPAGPAGAAAAGTVSSTAAGPGAQRTTSAAPAVHALKGKGGSPALGGTIPQGCHAVICPADGVFYRRPRSGDPAYVEAGATIRAGQTLGLIEAMKTFSPIPYGGPGLPAEATVVEVRAGDSEEVRHGQILFVVR
jgi:acetyl-CoA carboxylase biotin carboxyl carrier protein